MLGKALLLLVPLIFLAIQVIPPLLRRVKSMTTAQASAKIDPRKVGKDIHELLTYLEQVDQVHCGGELLPGEACALAK